VRLVLDTSVIVAAFRSLNGASRKLVDAFDQRRFELLLSYSLLREYEDVLLRPEHREVHGFSVREVTEVLDTIAARAIPVTPHFDWRPQLRDPGDEHVLATAINGGAGAIITHNVADFLPAAHDFGIQILTPGRIIRERF
jgi:putative PIN family toxin of toxin-antitoxin system